MQWINPRIQRLKPPCRPLTGKGRLPATPHIGLGPFALMAVTGNRVPAAAPPISGAQPPSSHPFGTAGSPGLLWGHPGRGAVSRGRGQGPCPPRWRRGGAA